VRKSQEESIILSKQNPIHHDFKIRWSKNDGSGLFFDAISKTSVKLAQLAEEKIPFTMYRPYYWRNDCILCYVRDINISEPGALIGSAGPRVVRDTTGLPEGFQTAEFLRAWFLRLYHATKELKDKINLYIDLIQNNDIR
jgi:acetyl-CoA carboxylase carboxyl transferase subunit beta